MQVEARCLHFFAHIQLVFSHTHTHSPFLFLYFFSFPLAGIKWEDMYDEEGSQLDDAFLFQRWYFNTAEGAREPRLGFLEIKVAEMVRHLRVSALELRNKIPPPVFTMPLAAVP